MAGKKKHLKGKKPSASRATKTRQPSLVFWVLVGLSLVVIAIGIWQWQESRQVLAHQSQPEPPASGAAQASDFELMSADGSRVRLSDLKGKVVLLNFWATWCPPCRAEMPDLNSLHREYGSRHNFTVVGVNLEESQEAVQRFSQEFDIAFPLLLDRDGEVTANRYNLRSLPASLIIDREGRIRDKWMGQISKAAMLARLEQIW